MKKIKKMFYVIFIALFMVMLGSCGGQSGITNGQGGTTNGHQHEYGNVYYKDSDNHWNVCVCGEKVNISEHNYVDRMCNICGKKEYSIGLNYTLINNDTYSYEVTVGSCQDTDVVIPKKYKGYKVTSIGVYAFRDCSNLTSIEIPTSVTSIGDYAFSYCSSLTSIEIPTSVTSIGDGAFSNCSSLTSIEIPTSVTSIGDYAFSKCSKLTSITIPDSVTSIGDYAFSGCSNLQYNIYDNGKYIGNKENPYLVLIEAISSDITSCEINSNTRIIYTSAFSFCSNLTSITIPSSVTSIGSSAFSGCSNLTSIEIPSSVTSIGSSAFSGCSNLQYNIYDNGKYIGNKENPYLVLMDTTAIYITSCEINLSTRFIFDYAFSGCSRLTSITIPDSVTSIEYRAFSGCSNLTSITIPDSVTSIGESAFSNCDNLTDVYYTGTLEQWHKISIESDNNNLTNATILFLF